MPVRARSRASSSSRKASQFAADRAQLVELGVVAGGDDAAVAQQHGRLVGDRRAAAPAISAGGRERLGEHVEQHARRRAAARARSAGRRLQRRAQAGRARAAAPGAARCAR